MSHFPVNHPLRPFYRVLATIAGLYILVFGVVGIVRARLADRSTAVTGRARAADQPGIRGDVDGGGRGDPAGRLRWAQRRLRGRTSGAASVFMVVGTATGAAGTDFNVLNFSMATVIVSFVIGMLLFTAGLYGRSASRESAGRGVARRASPRRSKHRQQAAARIVPVSARKPGCHPRMDAMAHIPVNHHLQPFYRTLAGLAGLYVLVFGIVGVVQTRGLPLFRPGRTARPCSGSARTGPSPSSRSWPVWSLLGGAVIGRNVDHWINLIAGRRLPRRGHRHDGR